MSDVDLSLMRQALDLAELGLYTTTPNPRVGCLIVKNGQVIAQGFHQRAGGDHAEIVALKSAQQNGFDVVGSTVYVTLEPCSHTGRTPPCTEALVKAGVSRVVVLSPDPNPLVAGSGVAFLRAHGIEVTQLGDRDLSLTKRHVLLNAGFFSRMLRSRPWVRLKMAASLDGITALSHGESQWITGELARNDGHHWRARSCVVLSTAKTVIQDQARLTVRAVNTPRQPIRVILDTKQQLRPDMPLFENLSDAPVWVVASNIDHLKGLEGVRCLPISVSQAFQAFSFGTPLGRVNLVDLFMTLAKEQINEVHVEAGSLLAGSLVQGSLVDECVTYLAPTFLGKGFSLLNMPEVEHLTQASGLWSFESVDQIGKDVRLRLTSIKSLNQISCGSTSITQ